MSNIKYQISNIRFIRLFCILLFTIYYLLSAINVFSQDIKVSAELDSNSILIGQHAKLTLKVEYSIGQGQINIDFPKITDTIIQQIEVIEKSKIIKYLPDSNDINSIAEKQIFTITSFDSGYYAIPPLLFVVNGDTSKRYETEPLLFSVNTIAVDTTLTIKDIKPPLEVPFSWKELLPYFYWGLGIAAILTAIIFLIIFFVKRRKKKPAPVIIIPKIPAHKTAIERLEKLKEEKLWQQGKVKQYHSEISEILRQYIEHRFYISAMEQVTYEILYAFRTVDITEDIKIKLRQILILSDLVKFAKEQPLPNENESIWENAFDFVNTTKIEEKIANTVANNNQEKQVTKITQ
ncbi:MAG: hypothetical protein V1781_01250 [Bacteroidota bacterium]